MADLQVPQRLTVSLHIPKTAGTSFADVLRRAYGDQAAFFYREKNPLTHPKLITHHALKDAEVLADLEAEGVRVIHGHAPGAWFLRNIPDQGRYWTWLRDPVERVISAYFYLVQRAANGRATPEKVQDMTLLDYAGLESNRDTQSSVLKGFDLERMGFVGVTERFTDGLRLLGLEDYEPTKIRNRTKDKPEVDADTRRRIAELNADDMALYQRGLELFAARTSEA